MRSGFGFEWRVIREDYCASASPPTEAKIAKPDIEECEGARFGVGEIGLRRDRDQKRCLQSQKREIEFGKATFG